MTDHALAVRSATVLPSADEWRTLVEMARVLVPTGFLPKDIRTPEQAVAIILKGRELRVPPMHALSSIVVVQGKPTASAELMLALIYRDHGDKAVVVEESTPEVCRVSYRRPGWDAARSFAFTIADARTAELAGKGTWKQYPQAMLRARAVSAVARLAFPDSIGGMHTPEELGAEVHVAADGAVEVAPPAEPGPSPRALAAVAEMDAAVADNADLERTERSSPPLPRPVVPPEAFFDPVSEETRLAWVAFVDEVEAANPRIKVKLPGDHESNATWMEELHHKRTAWAQSPHNPARVAVPAG